MPGVFAVMLHGKNAELPQGADNGQAVELFLPVGHQKVAGGEVNIKGEEPCLIVEGQRIAVDGGGKLAGTGDPVPGEKGGLLKDDTVKGVTGRHLLRNGDGVNAHLAVNVDLILGDVLRPYLIGAGDIMGIVSVLAQYLGEGCHVIQGIGAEGKFAGVVPDFIDGEDHNNRNITAQPKKNFFCQLVHFI